MTEWHADVTWTLDPGTVVAINGVEITLHEGGHLTYQETEPLVTPRKKVSEMTDEEKERVHFEYDGLSGVADLLWNPWNEGERAEQADFWRNHYRSNETALERLERFLSEYDIE